MTLVIFLFQRMHSSQNPHEVKFTKQQLDGILGENSWLKQDNAMQRAVNAGLREKISKWQTYAKLLKRELEKKDAEIKEVTEKLAKKNKECEDLNDERSAASVSFKCLVANCNAREIYKRLKSMNRKLGDEQNSPLVMKAYLFKCSVKYKVLGE